MSSQERVIAAASAEVRHAMEGLSRVLTRATGVWDALRDLTRAVRENDGPMSDDLEGSLARAAAMLAGGEPDMEGPTLACQECGAMLPLPQALVSRFVGGKIHCGRVHSFELRDGSQAELGPDGLVFTRQPITDEAAQRALDLA